jgi:hypothetical protein
MRMNARELDHRSIDGLDVRLLWDPGENKVTVLVDDRRNGEIFEVEVGPGDSVLDVFHHPFAYNPVRKVVLAPAA